MDECGPMRGRRLGRTSDKNHHLHRLRADALPKSFYYQCLWLVWGNPVGLLT